jgi:hypothetical protein
MSSGYINLPLTSGSGGVESLNSLTGALTLVAGTGITITPGSGTLTIDALGGGLVFPIVAPAGSVSAPSYAFSESGNDTGMYSTGDGNLSFAADGVLRVTINNVGLTVNGDIAADNYPPTGNTNTFAGFDGSGDLFAVPTLLIEPTWGGWNQPLNIATPDIGGQSINNNSIAFSPPADAVDANFTMFQAGMSFDVASSGFDQGTSGQAGQFINMSFQHQGTGDIGALNFVNGSFNLGNGTDPINVGGISYYTGGGGVSANVNVTGNLSGFGFQPNFSVSSTLAQGVNAFFDGANLPIAVEGYNSMNMSPAIGSINTNHNYVCLNNAPNITTFTGNAGYYGVAISPSIGTMNDGGFTGVSVNPNITLLNTNAIGMYVNMSGVTVFAGVQASLVVQDITYTRNQAGTDGNNITVEYLNTTTAGNEVATLVGGEHIQVTIEDGVSTATQVKAALDANPTILGALTTVITGTAGNAQITYAQTNLAGGINPGTKKAAQFDGDVSINGALAFTGDLTVGQLTSFANVDISAYPPGVNMIDSLITSPTVVSNTTLNTDLLAINTAMLLTVGDNCTLTSSFLGYSALGLPAVVSLGTGTTVDHVTGATFAISLGSGGAGTISNVELCRALALPNGTTAVTNLKGYAFDLPFGDPGTTTWGVYITPTCHNFMAGDLKIGTGGDVAQSGYALHVGSNARVDVVGGVKILDINEVTGMLVFDKSAVLSIDTDSRKLWSSSASLIAEFSTGLGFFATSPVSQQASSGPQTAGAVYTATEQTMIQEMYNALRAYGLLT